MNGNEKKVLKPAGSLISIEKYSEYEGIITPDTLPTTGDLFIVKDAGPGFLNDKGERQPMDVKPGDIVAVLGKIFTVTFHGVAYNIARSEDVIAYCRDV